MLLAERMNIIQFIIHYWNYGLRLLIDLGYNYEAFEATTPPRTVRNRPKLSKPVGIDWNLLELSGIIEETELLFCKLALLFYGLYFTCMYGNQV